MTIEELQRSDKAKEFFAHLVKHPTFSAVLDAAQRLALPTAKSVRAQVIPGVHPDTTLAHDTHFWAGWSECINFLRAIPTGSAALPAPPDEEELFAHTPAVAEIDKEIEAANKRQQPPAPTS